MGQVNIDDAVDSTGGKIKSKNDTAAEKESITWTQPQARGRSVVVYTALQNSDGSALDFRYQPTSEKDGPKPNSPKIPVTSPALRARECIIDKNGSTCTVSIESPTLTKLSDYSDGILGFLFDKTINTRHHILVVSLAPDTEFPAINEKYNENNASINGDIVLFSGYNKVGAGIKIGGGPGDKITLVYSGIEQGLNDFQVSGAINWDLITGINKKPAEMGARGIRHTYGDRCIFNEGGRPDQMDFTGLTRGGSGLEGPYLQIGEDAQDGDSLTMPFFNKSGGSPYKYWTLRSCLAYVVGWYCQDFLDSDGNYDIEHRKDLPDTFQIKTKFRNYAKFTVDLPEDLDDEIPSDLNIDGLGAWDAVLKIMEQSLQYDVAGGYDQTGRFKVEFSPKINRDASVHEILLQRSDFEEDYNNNKIVDNSTGFLNRDNSNIGRIIVRGAPVVINTLCSSLAELDIKDPVKASGNAWRLSSTEDTFTDATGLGITEWGDKIAMYPAASTAKKGLSSSLYLLSTHLLNNGFGAKVPLTSAQLNGDTNLNLFDNWQNPEVLDVIQPSFSEQKNKRQPAELYVTDVINEEDNKKDWIFLKPQTRSQTQDALISPDKQGAIVLQEKGSNDDSTAYNDLIELTKADPLILGDNKSQFGDAETLAAMPAVMRASIRTSYQIKGISQITEATHGVNFDPAIHQTKVIDDDRFELSLRYKDGEYVSSGGSKAGTNSVILGYFTPLADGFIPKANGQADSKQDEPLVKIQKFADRWLDRLVTIPQNSGELKLRGLQESLALGKFITKVEGGERTFQFPTPINRIRYDFDRIKTFASLGNVNMPEPKEGENLIDIE